MSTGVANSPWNGALIAMGSIAGVTPFAVVRDWGFESWIWAVAVCVSGGIMSSLTQIVRNRRIDRMVERARQMDSTAGRNPSGAHGEFPAR
jgi:hypothetical protein